MNKFYITLAAVLLGSASMDARELTFFLGDTPIANEENVQFKDIEVTPVGGGKSEVLMEPQLYLFSDLVTSSVQITARCISGHTVSMCAGGLCVANTVVVKDNVSVASNQKLPLEFHYEDYIESGQQAPQVVTEFEAVDTRRPETKKTFTLVMNPSTGVSSVIAGNDCFRAVNGGIEYRFDVPTVVEIYNITGGKMLSTNLNGSGVLSGAEFTAGVYIYSLNGKSGKIYIR